MSQPSPYSDEARVERAQQPPEPARPYDDDDLAFFRERARQRFFSLSGPPARLLATIDLREAERDALRAAITRYLAARDAARPADEQAARDDLDRLLGSEGGQ